MIRFILTLAFVSFLVVPASRAADRDTTPTTPPIAAVAHTWRRLTVTNSWFANSYADARFMPQGIEGMFVTPDGATYTNIRWEEGGGNVAVVTADGEVQPRPQVPGYHGWGHGGGRAVTANSKYVFFSQNYINEGGGLKNPDNWPPAGKDWYGISRRARSNIGSGPAFVDGKGGKDSPTGCFLPVHEVTNSTKADAVHLRSLCASEDELFVSCPFDNQIHVYDAEQMTLKRSWTVQDAWQLARDEEGAIWVAIGEDATVLKRYDAKGNPLPQSITLPGGSRLGSFCVDGSGRLLIGDVGPNEQVLTRGDIWMTCWGPLRKISYQGLDRHGVPIYDGAFTTIPAPQPLDSVRRVRYDPEKDVMYLAGTVGDKTHHWKSMGNHLCRYDRWSTGHRTAAWHVVCTYQKGTPCEPISFDVAGDYAFVAVAERGKVGDQQLSRGHIDVYDAKTGATVGYIEPPQNWGTGWMDAVECLSVFQRKNGEYLIIEEEDGRSKNLLYRWNPPASSRLP